MNNLINSQIYACNYIGLVKRNLLYQTNKISSSINSQICGENLIKSDKKGFFISSQ